MTPQEYLRERERINGRDPETSVAHIESGDEEPGLRLDPNIRVFVGQGITSLTSADGDLRFMLDVVFIDPETNEPIIPEPILLPVNLFRLERTYEDTTGGMG